MGLRILPAEICNHFVNFILFYQQAGKSPVAVAFFVYGT